MVQRDVAALARRLSHREADFESGHSPAGVVKRRDAADYRRMKLVDDFHSRHVRRRKRLEFDIRIAADEYPLRRRAEIRVLARCDHKPEMLMGLRNGGRGPTTLSSIPKRMR